MAAVQARIATLQGMLGLQAVGVLGGTSTSSTSGTSSSGTDFASMLAGALGGVGTSGDASTGSSIGDRAVALARSYTGVPYLWGGTDPSKGLDCSGLTQLVYGKLGITLPRVAADQAKAGVEVGSIDQAQSGDLVFFGSPAHHVGIYVGDGKMIDAPHSGSSVGVHAVAGYGPVTHVRRLVPTAEGTIASRSVPGVALSTGADARVLALQSALASSGAAVQEAALSDGSDTGTGGTTLTGPYASLFTAAGNRYGVDPALLSAVADTESGYDPSATSSAGAKGLMQLMPTTARSLGVDPADPAQAVDGAARMLSGLLTQFGGRTDLALAGYNAGSGAVHRYGGVPPYPETRAYVQRVTHTWKALR
jgi:hypothetical protein